MEPLITSAANPVVKRVRALAQRKHRQREGVAVVQGAQPVRQAVEAGFAVEALVVAPDLLRPDSAAFVDAQRAGGVPVSALSAELFGRISDRDGPSGLAAIVRTALRDPAMIAAADGPCTVVALDRIANPGNLGTILRTADATGAAGVLLVGATADPFDPAAVKASMGAVFHVPVARLPDLDALFGWAAAHRVAVATTSADGADPLWRTAFPDRLALLMGPEGDGLTADVVRRGDLAVAIPMVGEAESLNLAVATGVLLYDVWRSRGLAGATAARYGSAAPTTDPRSSP